MSLKKRGLGRGLEALLADDSEKQRSQAIEKGIDTSAAQRNAYEVEDRTATVVGLFKNIQRENRVLLEEAESLRQLIAEFESVVRSELS